MSKTFTFNRTVNSVDDAGIVVVREETVAFDPESGEFIIGLPKHVALMADYGNVHDKVLTEAVAKYEIACDNYSRQRLGITYEPVLMLVFATEAGGMAKQFGIGETLCIGLVPVALFAASRLGPTVTTRYRYEDGSVGPEVRFAPNLNRWYLPDTPEVRAKYEELAASMRKAGEILWGIDGPDYFLKISHGGSEPSPAEPVASASDDPAQPQLPFGESAESTVEDDEL